MHEFEIHRTTTTSFSPDQGYVDATLAKLTSSILTSLRKKKKFYIVVGLKVAHKATVYHMWNGRKSLGGSLGTSPIAVDANVSLKGGSIHMWDKEEIDFRFIYAYQLRACVNDGHAAYKLRPIAERRDGNLYDLSSKSRKTAPSETVFKFELARANENQDAPDIFCDFVGDFRDAGEAFQGVLLKPNVPVSYYVAAVMGVCMYAWLLSYLLM